MPYEVADSVIICDEYIQTVLDDDATIQTEAPGGAWNEAAEQETIGRIVRFTYQSTTTAANDTPFLGMEIINNDIIYELHTYLIRMVGENDRPADLAAGSTRIKQLFHKTRSGDEFTSGRILWSKYLLPWKERVPDGDRWYPELGGFYQFAVQPPQA